MNIERRNFIGSMMAAGAGILALARGVIALAKELPSDPGAKVEAGPDEIALPAFAKDSQVRLDDALLKRRTSRNFDQDATLTKEQLSRLLWAANGVNREDGHRTAPSAMAYYPVDVLVALPEGVYRYENKKHALVKVSGEDVREKIPIQPGLKKSAMKILYVINKDRLKGTDEWMADLEIGCMVQNVYLEAAGLDLGACVFAIASYDKISKIIGLKDNQKYRITQAVGPLRD